MTLPEEASLFAKLLLNCWVQVKVVVAIVFARQIDHFTVSCLGAWPLNESEARGDFVLIETSLLFS